MLFQPIQKVVSMSGNPVQALAEPGLGWVRVTETFAESGIGGIEGEEVEVHAGWARPFVYRDDSFSP